MKKMIEKYRQLPKGKKIALACILLAVVLIVVFLIYAVGKYYYNEYRKEHFETISYAEYQTLLDEDRIDTLTYHPDDPYMYISLRNEETKNMTIKEREEYISPDDEIRRVYYPGNEDFVEDLLSKDILVFKRNKNADNIPSQVLNIVYWGMFIVFMLWMMKRMTPAGRGMVEEINADDIDVTFDDIIGHDEVKEDLRLLIRQIKSKDRKFRDLTHGILFEGGPGTGKTMLAKAVAKEAGFGFVSVDSSSLIQVYVGVGAKRVREAFEKAKKIAPCIVFFDEIDAIGTKRGASRGNSENDQTINALLAEIDGFGTKEGIFVIAATNRAKDLDPALVRAGRFDRTIKIEAPNKWETRKELFDHYLSENAIDETVNTESLAKQTVGYSGADIAAVCREAHMIMFSKEKNSISQDDLEEAIDKILFKGNRSSDEKEETQKIVAYHEAGHAVMTMICNKPIARISIMGMTSGVGGAVFHADEGKLFHTKKDIEDEICILYAGRASEEIRFGKENVTNGASNDITEATKMLVGYVTKYGFCDDMIDYAVFEQENLHSEEIMKKISELSAHFYERTLAKLKDNYEAVEKLADKLMQEKSLSGEEVVDLKLSVK